ncbi:MAG TPA: dihydroneopterin triphosphate diphosphatase [Acidiferrobacteraceae bacterium]|nr:dihydroneopterin triphosphate diphosphatase [Acidiferrobacteraceae bacterium]
MIAFVAKRPESVLVVIHTPLGGILLLERADYPSFWQSVTGSLEAEDQDLLATARREVQEETGLCPETGWRNWNRVQEFEIFAHWRHRYAPGVTRNREHMFSLEVAPDTPVVLHPQEHRRFGWWPHAEAAIRCSSASNRQAILWIAQAYGWR